MGVEDLVPPPTLAFVRPGPRALEWLAREVAALKGDDPLRPVTVVVPNMYAARMALGHLARQYERARPPHSPPVVQYEGARPLHSPPVVQGGYANVRPLRLAELATRIARPEAARRQPLTPVLALSAVRVATGRQLRFREVAHQPALHAALAALFRELRRQEIDRRALMDGGWSDVGRAALACYALFRQLTRDRDDPTEVRERATARLFAAHEPPPELAELGALVLFLPTRLDPADARLLAALVRWGPLRVAFAAFQDPQRLADEQAEEDAALVARQLGIAVPTAAEALERFELRCEARVIRAPEPAEEVREITRAIARDLERGVALHHTAILYRQPRPYATLLREVLDLAGLPWSALDGRSLLDSRPASSLLDLLRLPERAFAREAVLRWASASPALVRQSGAPRLTSWERLSREAGIVRGAEQWVKRLQAHADALEEGLLRPASGGAPGQPPGEEGEEGSAAVRWQAAVATEARWIAGLIAELEVALRPPADGSRWAAFVTWAERLRVRFGGEAAAWPEEERPFAEDLATALAELAEADTFEGEMGTSVALFLSTLEAELRRCSRAVGRLGEGIMLGPVQAVAGLAFERVYLVGMTEGAFPSPPPVDPFFTGATNGEDPLQRRARQRRDERRAFLTALAAADGGVATLSLPDAAGDRAAFPSRWLLEVAAARLGRSSLDASGFKALKEADCPWLRVVSSARAGVVGAAPPADLEDRRLQQAATWTAAGLPLHLHPLARRTDLPVGSGLATASARRSRHLTQFDGNLGRPAATAARIARVFDGSAALSASRLETWAQCPFRYFLGYVLRVTATEAPEERWSISPRDRGSLVHDVLHDFFGQLAGVGRPAPREQYTPDDYRLLEQITGRHFQLAEQRGLVGHPVVWEVSREGILADLHSFLREDQRWRAVSGFQPRFFEQAFGFDEPGSWPAVEIQVAGTDLRLRGRIDRVDLDPAGTRGYVFDYKTGRAEEVKGAEGDPLLAGKRMQVALYVQAVRRQLGERASVGGAYWFITSRSEFEQQPLVGDDAETERRLAVVAEKIAGGIQAGCFPQVPGEEDEFYRTFENCKYCDYQRICPAGRDDQWSRKQSDTASAPYLALAGDDQP